jgi:hypothetical protein
VGDAEMLGQEPCHPSESSPLIFTACGLACGHIDNYDLIAEMLYKDIRAMRQVGATRG